MSNIAKNMLLLATSSKSVFTIAELAIFWGIENKNILRVTISRAKKNGYLQQIQRGVYKLKEKEVDPLELAGKLRKHSYISFETVLAQAGVVFQWSDKITSAGGRSMEVENKFGKFSYRKIPQDALTSNEGIINKGNYFTASVERALCDKIYKDGLAYFDSLGEINREKAIEISKIYHSKRLKKDIKKLFKL